MKANITPELFAGRRRQITEADVRRYLGDMLADRRVTANAVLVAAAILTRIDACAVATASDIDIRDATGGKLDDRKMEGSRARLRRTGWAVWRETTNPAGEKTFTYAFPKLGRVERLQ